MLTFLLFSRNDHPDEQFRVTLSLESLIDQDTTDRKIILMDLSEKGKELILPKTDILKVIYNPVAIGRDFYPSYYRNLMALEADTPIICHVNADCVYSKNFASVVIKTIKADGDSRLVLCERRNADEKETAKIKTLQDAREFMKKCDRMGGSGACGECQGIDRKKFLNMGGYWGLIKKQEGKFIVEKGNWEEHAWGEDRYLKEGGSNMGIGEKWITSDARLLHLHHIQRENAANRKKYK